MTTPVKEDPPDLRHLRLLAGMSFRPVFIMGSARSGTTILYRLLSMTGCFNYVSAYHLIKYDEVLSNHVSGTTEQAKRELGDLFRRLGIAGSRFDGVEVYPDFPEEYGFALARGFVMRLGPATLPRFTELCRKVQYVSDPGRPLLLKNPWDFRRFLYVKQVLPESRFVFIHRHPARVIRSMVEGLGSLLESRNPYHALLAGAYDRLTRRPVRFALARLLFASRFGPGRRIVGWQVARSARYFLDHVGELAESDYLSVRYEDLCRDPGVVMRRILSFLELEERNAVNYRSLVRARERPLEDAGWNVMALVSRLELESYLSYCGYDADSPAA